MKIVINSDYGGFDLSKEALEYMGIDVTIDDYDGIETVIEEGHYWC